MVVAVTQVAVMDLLIVNFDSVTSTVAVLVTVFGIVLVVVAFVGIDYKEQRIIVPFVVKPYKG